MSRTQTPMHVMMSAKEKLSLILRRRRMLLHALLKLNAAKKKTG